MTPVQTLPHHEINSFARWVVKATEMYFNNPDNQKRFEEWKKERVSNADKKQ